MNLGEKAPALFQRVVYQPETVPCCGEITCQFCRGEARRIRYNDNPTVAIDYDKYPISDIRKQNTFQFMLQDEHYSYEFSEITSTKVGRFHKVNASYTRITKRTGSRTLANFEVGLSVSENSESFTRLPVEDPVWCQILGTHPYDFCFEPTIHTKFIGEFMAPRVFKGFGKLGQVLVFSQDIYYVNNKFWRVGGYCINQRISKCHILKTRKNEKDTDLIALHDGVHYYIYKNGHPVYYNEEHLYCISAAYRKGKLTVHKGNQIFLYLRV